jgi:integrase
VASVQKLKGRNRWRVRYREGGRGTKEKASRWFDDKPSAVAECAAIDRRLRALQPADARVTLDDLVERWGVHQRTRRQPRGERYIGEGQRTLRATIKANRWTYCDDVRQLDVGPGVFRLMKALLRFGRDHYEQTLHSRALVAPDRQRNKRPPAPLPSLEDVLHMAGKAAEWSAGNGAIAHLVAVYGHRPESLVRLTPAAVDRSYVTPTPVGHPAGMGWLTLKVKGGRIVRHPLLPATLALLDPLVADARRPRKDLGPLLFVNHGGKGWETGQAFSSWFHHSVGQGRGIYRLKCWAITWMWAGGIDLQTISSITGHTTDTIRKYLRTNEAMQHDALAVIARSGVLAAPFGVDDVCT